MSIGFAFASEGDADRFRERYCQIGRIYPQDSLVVHAPVPTGLLRVRISSKGEMAFDFSRSVHAYIWNMSIGKVGTIRDSTSEQPHRTRTVYMELKK